MVHDLLAEGISVLWSTAYLDEAERCDNVLLLNEGKLLYHGTPAKLCKRVEGRSFLIKNITGNRRLVLQKALQQENVIDGTLQGNQVRIVVKKPSAHPIDLSALDGGPKLRVAAVPARFEDAFIDILGGRAWRAVSAGRKNPKD